MEINICNTLNYYNALLIFMGLFAHTISCYFRISRSCGAIFGKTSLFYQESSMRLCLCHPALVNMLPHPCSLSPFHIQIAGKSIQLDLAIFHHSILGKQTRFAVGKKRRCMLGISDILFSELFIAKSLDCFNGKAKEKGLN